MQIVIAAPNGTECFAANIDAYPEEDPAAAMFSASAEMTSVVRYFSSAAEPGEADGH